MENVLENVSFIQNVRRKGDNEIFSSVLYVSQTEKRKKRIEMKKAVRTNAEKTQFKAPCKIMVEE